MKDSIRAGAFSPAWWCPGSHAQTIWRRVFGEILPLPLRRERWQTPDKDFLDLDFTENWDSELDDPPPPVVLLLHGLEGSSRAKYILGMLARASKLKWRGVALNFRSCSGELNKQKRFYHSGETSDLSWVVEKLILRFPQNPIFIIGFSLGGNVLLKWLGEKGRSIPDQIRAVTAVSVPFDLGVAARRIDRGFNRVYGRVFLKTLREKALAKEYQFPGLVDAQRVSRMVSFAEFDNEVTAPIHGFQDAQDYWMSSSSIHFLESIQTPCLLISAQDDPFLPASHIPFRMVEQSKWLRGCFPRRGGHVGFVEGAWPWKASYWIESKTFAFFYSFV